MKRWTMAMIGGGGAIVSMLAVLPAAPGPVRGPTTKAAGEPPALAAMFKPFAEKVALTWDKQYLFVGSDGMPEHSMMVGITAWQQQVPLPQPYTGDNAWRIPLHPVKGEKPVSAKTHFFRGAIALAANGVPIFNPIKNDGRTDTFLAGELDDHGGHSGRADDYHYHIAPMFLEKIVGAGKPIAVALDGYAIYGSTEADGTKLDAKTLDEFNGHMDKQGNYHYHGTATYPYVNGGFHGQITEREGQVDPQPRAEPVREAGAPLRGAKVTEFSNPKPQHYTLKYEADEEVRTINYWIDDAGAYHFEFVDATGKKTEKVYRRHSHDHDERHGDTTPPPRRPQ